MALYKISSSRVNNIEASEYAGSVVEQGLIWYDPESGILRLYNGEVGGYIINSGSSGNVDLSAVDQDIVPATSTLYNLGSEEKPWKELFVSDGSIYIGSVRLSNDTGALMVGDAENQDIDPHTIIRGERDVNDYASLSLRNNNIGNKASTDVLLYQGGSETSHYIDMGIASPNYDYLGFETIKPGDGYVFVAGGNIKIGTSTPDTKIMFFTGGTDAGDHEVAYVAKDQGLVLLQGQLTFADGTSLSTAPPTAGVFGLVIDGGNAVSSSSDFIIDGGGA